MYWLTLSTSLGWHREEQLVGTSASVRVVARRLVRGALAIARAEEYARIRSTPATEIQCAGIYYAGPPIELAGRSAPALLIRRSPHYSSARDLDLGRRASAMADDARRFVRPFLAASVHSRQCCSLPPPRR